MYKHSLANPGTVAALPLVQQTASALGVDLVPKDITARDDIADAIVAMARERIQALVVIEEPLIISNARRIAELALQQSPTAP